MTILGSSRGHFRVFGKPFWDHRGVILGSSGDVVCVRVSIIVEFVLYFGAGMVRSSYCLVYTHCTIFRKF